MKGGRSVKNFGRSGDSEDISRQWVSVRICFQGVYPPIFFFGGGGGEDF